jgi:phage baseplate assembly protein gpV
MATKLELRFSDLRVEVDRPMQRSWAMGTATVVGTMRSGGGHMESRAVVLRFDKEEDQWRIADVALPGADAP